MAGRAAPAQTPVMFATVDHAAAPAAIYGSAPALTPAIAVQNARAMVAEALDVRARARFRHTGLRKAAPNLVFCGQVNAVYDTGPTGWRDVMIVVSGDPALRAVVIDHGPAPRDLIRQVCDSATPVGKGDYSATLNVW